MSSDQHPVQSQMVAVGCPGHGPGLPLGGQRCSSHRRGRIRREFPGAARSDASHRVQLRDCMDFPAIINTAVAVSTLMLVALGDKPARRGRSAITAASTQNPAMQRAARNEKPQVTRVRSAQSACTDGASRPRNGFASVQLDATQTVRSAQADVPQDDADLASDLIASGVTTQSVDTVIAVLSAHRDGASINAAAKVSGIN
jgi:hypothetical protein